jgi:UDP-2,3-diacylglucosamine hydrolase
MSDARRVFVSDVHLRFDDRPYLDRFLSFLKKTPDIAEEVYVHGDLFDFYVGPKQGARAFYRPLFETIREVVGRGVKIVLLHGNRDYLAGADFEAAGAAVVPDRVDLQAGRYRARVSHGDEYCVHDHSYQRAKKVLRAGPIRALTRALPVPVAVAAARLYRRISARKAKKFKAAPNGRLPTLFDGVQAAIDAEPLDVVVAGHIHEAASTPFTGLAGPVRLLTTGAWDEWGDGPNYVYFDGTEFSIVKEPR